MLVAGHHEHGRMRRRHLAIARAAAVVATLLALALGVLTVPVLAQTAITGDPAGTTADPTGTTADPTGATSNPAGTTSNPAGTTSNPAGTTAKPTITTTTPPPATALPADPKTEKQARPATRHQFDSSSTLQLKPPQKVAERKKSCAKGTRLATSGMLNLRIGTVGGDRHRSQSILILGLAVGGAALALLWWRFHGRWGTSERKGVLDVLGATIAICAGIAALTAQFIPGVGVHDHPPPELSMAVTQVHARVQHGSYLKAVAEPMPAPLDQLEIGNVVWLQLGLKGYQGRTLRLQWAEYNLDTGGAFLQNTEGHQDFHVDHDAETRFEPVWVGYPRSGRFQVQLRVLQDGEVRGMARTGEMRGTQYRYACQVATT
jgi:hypothetical protein